MMDRLPDNAILHRNPANEVDYFLIPNDKNDEYGFSGILYQVMARDSDSGLPLFDDPLQPTQIAEIFLKWDGCAHVGLLEPDLKVWAHICGPLQMENTLMALRWMWHQAQNRIAHYQPDQRLT